jgi:hypothetical protein
MPSPGFKHIQIKRTSGEASDMNEANVPIMSPKEEYGSNSPSRHDKREEGNELESANTKP